MARENQWPGIAHEAQNYLAPAGRRDRASTLLAWRAEETPLLADQVLTVPPGFEVERVAGPPLVNRPIVADFDERGPALRRRFLGLERQGRGAARRTKPHRIVRLEDTDGDGRFDKSIVFADKMMFPEGAMWFDGSLYVAAPPSIWKLTDTDDDGVADQREEWFQGKTLTGCANDLHGPYLGPDGWIYWTQGRVRRADLRAARQAAARDARGAHLPPPAGRAGDRAGDDRRHGQSGRRRVHRRRRADLHHHVSRTSAGWDGATGSIHAIYGGVYGKPHAVIDGHKRTGDLMPVLTHLGPAAPGRADPLRVARVRRRSTATTSSPRCSTCTR